MTLVCCRLVEINSRYVDARGVGLRPTNVVG